MRSWKSAIPILTSIRSSLEFGSAEDMGEGRAPAHLTLGFCLHHFRQLAGGQSRLFQCLDTRAQFAHHAAVSGVEQFCQ